MASNWLKQMNSALFEFMKRPMPLAVCSRLCSRDLAGAGAFASSARLHA